MDRITKKEIESYNEFVISLGYEYCYEEDNKVIETALKDYEILKKDLTKEVLEDDK